MKAMQNKIITLIITMFFTMFLCFSSTINILADEKIPFKIGVNRFAWYATLQNINFMPLVSADPFAGVILTDWYSVTENERYKIDVYILEEHLTANTVQVKVFKQKKQGNTWVDAKVPTIMSNKIEDAILNTSRKLRIENMLGEN